jgi:hypothetical protein
VTAQLERLVTTKVLTKGDGAKHCRGEGKQWHGGIGTTAEGVAGSQQTGVRGVATAQMGKLVATKVDTAKGNSGTAGIETWQ